jgi:hypothetical protein
VLLAGGLLAGRQALSATLTASKSARRPDNRLNVLIATNGE